MTLLLIERVQPLGRQCRHEEKHRGPAESRSYPIASSATNGAYSGTAAAATGSRRRAVSATPPRRRRWTVMEAKNRSSAWATTAATIVLTARAIARCSISPLVPSATAPTVAAVIARLLV